MKPTSFLLGSALLVILTGCQSPHAPGVDAANDACKTAWQQSDLDLIRDKLPPPWTYPKKDELNNTSLPTAPELQAIAVYKTTVMNCERSVIAAHPTTGSTPIKLARYLDARVGFLNGLLSGQTTYAAYLSSTDGVIKSAVAYFAAHKTDDESSAVLFNIFYNEAVPGSEGRRTRTHG